MFVKLAILACSIAVSAAVYNGPLAGGLPAHQFPAGVSPQACPNFPNCANPAVAANPQQAAQWGAQPQWNAQPQQWNAQPQQWNAQPQQQWNQWNAQPVPQYGHNDQERLNRGEYIGDGDYHGEGLAEALAEGYTGNQWNNGGNNWNNGNNWNHNQGIPPNAHQTHGVGQIPAGVNPQSCPNYPFCG
ncbi:unnamed protein product [Callosobruchus maculatus]|uniref:Cuticle protein CPCFC domain-containing protein n=1 Tax=Callosobruchus maculatus TaxID=64391 RepID=A0A653BY94_CALMS|nr:unnamed protein product [Callosobruchus maculatus]